MQHVCVTEPPVCHLDGRALISQNVVSVQGKTEYKRMVGWYNSMRAIEG
jgi:hypothetical protein